MGLPSPLVTRGLGSRPALVTTGFLPISTATQIARAVVRHGRSAKGKLEKKINEKLEQIKISVMLIEANGKELIKPIINTVTYKAKEGENINVTAQPQSVEYRKENIFKVWISKLKIKKD